MRWDFGKVYKLIRCSKGITQQQVCHKEFSRSALSKIEKGQAVPNFENMIFLLNQIDMTVDEFLYICDYYQPSERQNILNKFRQLRYNHDEMYLHHIIKLCHNYLRKQHDLPIKHISSILEATLTIREGDLHQSDRLRELTNQIWEYLEKQDTWYVSDLRLLITILYHFPKENLPLISKRILESLKKYKNFTDIKPGQLALLNNLATLYLNHGYLTECETYTLMALEVAKDLKRYDGLGLCYARLGLCQDKPQLLEDGMAILNLAGEEWLLKQVQQEIKAHRRA